MALPKRLLQQGVNDLVRVSDARMSGTAFGTVVPHVAPESASLLSTATVARGAAGCLTDGFVSDILEIRTLKLPVFHGGIASLDSKGRGEIMAADIPVTCAGVRVVPGDLVFGDADGVVVVPQEVEADVLKVAFDKINGGGHSMRELRAGGYLRDVYARYGAL